MAGAQCKPLFRITRPAARDLSSYQWHVMKLDTSADVDYVNTASAGKAWGVLENAPSATGEEATIITDGTAFCYADGNSVNISVGDPLGSNSSYHAVKVTSDKAQYFAVAMEASTADGDIIEVKLMGGPKYLAA